MKLSKDDFKKKLDEVITDEDVKINLLEDVEDSFEVDTQEKVDKSTYDELYGNYKELQKKYKDRFFEGVNKPDIQEKKEELQEKKYIDIREI